MESTLGLEIIEVVGQAAIASSKWMGKGEKNIADHVAVEAMRERMNKIHMRGRIVIGEGERDEAPMLYIGEEVGICTQVDAKQYCNPDELVEIDIAVDPCEGCHQIGRESQCAGDVDIPVETGCVPGLVDRYRHQFGDRVPVDPLRSLGAVEFDNDDRCRAVRTRNGLRIGDQQVPQR